MVASFRSQFETVSDGLYNFISTRIRLQLFFWAKEKDENKQTEKPPKRTLAAAAPFVVDVV